jgi:hypothetical protein
MTGQILRATPVAGLVAPNLRIAFRRFLNALDRFAAAKAHNAVPEQKPRRTQHDIHRYRRRIRAKHCVGVPSNSATLRSSETVAQTLDLSAAQAYDCALSILGAYKLTGNFHTNLELVLRDIGAFDKVTFEIKTGDRLLCLTDCRRVLFRSRENVHIGQFRDIICSIKNRLEFRGDSGPVEQNPSPATAHPSLSRFARGCRQHLYTALMKSVPFLSRVPTGR